MMNEQHKVENVITAALERYVPVNPETETKIVVGLSGGADSVALLRGILNRKSSREMSIVPVAVHLNHGIRAQEAERDQKFVEKLCEELGVKLHVFHADIPAMAEEKGYTEEEAGRLERYRIFEEVRQSEGAFAVAVAHHADDNAETILMNLFRGCGLTGLSGMEPFSQSRRILRPLLSVHKSEILDYLESLGQAYVTDSTNLETDARRNAVRNVIFPAIRESGFEGFEERILREAGMFREIDDYLQGCADSFCDEHVVFDTEGGAARIDGAAMRNMPEVLKKYMVREVLARLNDNCRKDFATVHVEDVCSLEMKNVGKSVNLPFAMIAERTYDGIAIRRVQEAGSGHKVSWRMTTGILTQDEMSALPGKVNDRVGDLETEGPMVCYVDADRLECPVLRFRQSGDRIVLFEDGGDKSLKDFMIDEKIPRQMRDCWPVVMERDGSHSCVWVVAKRVSAGYKVSKDTKNIMKITVEKV